ncbi:MAG: hypothetical protein Q3963_03070 [Coriobacteriaceae bacterium]|nr:hypothetical protein [Coriobacteriaceae bacterium]
MDIDRGLEVKLPLMGKSITLDPLPGQDPDVRYGVVWDVCQQPGDGLGYIVRFQDTRTCRILAWMGRGGVVNECDRPIAFVLPGVPALTVSHHDDSSDTGAVRVRRHGSDELVQAAAFRDYFPSQLAFEPVTGKGAAGVSSMSELKGVLGVYAERRLGWRVFIAVAYLAFYLMPRLGGDVTPATGEIADVLRSFAAKPLPDAIDSLIFRVLEAQEGGDAQASGFERYAARMLQQAGSSELRTIMAGHDVGIARLSTTHLYWLRIPEDVTPDERAVLLSVESCLNRLALIERALKEAGESTALATCRESRCALEDRHALARVADGAHALVDASQEGNPYCNFLPANPRRGGEWDVRTRFLRACESLPVPFRLEYRFDCHAEGGLLHAKVALPPLRAFPENRWNEAKSRWESRAGEVPALASCYALRLCALVAACGFGTSIGMRQVTVTACADSINGEPVLSMRFERMSYLNRALYRIDSGTVARVGGQRDCTAADVEVLLSLLAPMEARIRIGEDGGLLPVEELDPALPESRLPLSQDTRFLPSNVAHLLHADRVCDLDLEATTDLHELDAVQDAVDDAAESRLLAMAQLEAVVERNPIRGLADPDDIVAAAEAALRGGADVPGYEYEDEEGDPRLVRLVYFPNLFSRCLADFAARREDEEFELVPAPAFLARSALSKLYLEAGEVEAAIARARECALLAPTSAGLLLESAQLLLAAQQLDDAIDLLRQSLEMCVRQQMATVLYAHLAGAFWGKGMHAEALASFTLARRFEQGQSGFDHAIMQLGQHLGVDRMPSVDEAVATLRAQGIPLAPTEKARHIIVGVAVEFTDSRMFELAWPLVGAVGIDVGNDVMAMMGEHLRRGLG